MAHLPFWQVANSRALESEHARGSSASQPLTQKDSHSWGALGPLTWDSCRLPVEQTAGVGPGELTFPAAHVAGQRGDLYCPGACLCCWNLTAEEGGGRRVSFPRASPGGSHRQSSQLTAESGNLKRDKPTEKSPSSPGPAVPPSSN